jgi:heme-degrading monooxygenase HmoA
MSTAESEVTRATVGQQQPPPAGGTFRVMLVMHIHPGMEADFEQTWLRVGEAVTGHPANLGQWLMRSAEEPGVYHIISDWTDEPRFREFEHSAAHLAHRQKLHPFRSGGRMTTAQVVYHLPGAGATP